MNTSNTDKRFTRVRLDDVLRADADGMPIFRRCFGHEIMLTFFDDDGAINFREWWEDKGAKQFYEWIEDRK